MEQKQKDAKSAARKKAISGAITKGVMGVAGVTTDVMTGVVGVAEGVVGGAAAVAGGVIGGVAGVGKEAIGKLKILRGRAEDDGESLMHPGRDGILCPYPDDDNQKVNVIMISRHRNIILSVKL